jgi:hypothetical protein
VEWFLPEPTVPIRQGDVLVSRDPQTGTVDELCVVITADCDISKGKFGRQLACLRILTFKAYIAQVWARRKLDKAVRDESKKLRAQLVKWHSITLGRESTLTEEAARIWIARTEPAAICDALGVTEEGARKKLVATLQNYRLAFAAIESANDALTQLIAFKASINRMEPQECKAQALQQAQQESLPEDVFLLPALPLASDTPCVVMLREIVGVASESVCFRAADADTADVFLRIGRLHPPYKYAVSQAFGILYSRIGLPDEYERRCKEVVSDIVATDWE